MVMPMSGQVDVASIFSKLNITDLYNRLPKKRAIQVKFPKFKLEYAQELQGVFTDLGRITPTHSCCSMEARINHVLSAVW